MNGKRVPPAELPLTPCPVLPCLHAPCWDLDTGAPGSGTPARDSEQRRAMASARGLDAPVDGELRPCSSRRPRAQQAREESGDPCGAGGVGPRPMQPCPGRPHLS